MSTRPIYSGFNGMRELGSLSEIDNLAIGDGNKLAIQPKLNTSNLKSCLLGYI